MQNYRSLLFTISVDIGQIEFSRQTEVQLAGGQCIFITHSRFHVNIQLRTIESSLTDFLSVFDADFIQNLAQSILCIVPHFIVIVIFYLVLRITQRQYTAIIRDIEIFVGIKDQVHYLGKFILDLLRCYEQVSIVLAEVTASLDAL